MTKRRAVVLFEKLMNQTPGEWTPVPLPCYVDALKWLKEEGELLTNPELCALNVLFAGHWITPFVEEIQQ